MLWHYGYLPNRRCNTENHVWDLVVVGRCNFLIAMCGTSKDALEFFVKVDDMTYVFCACYHNTSIFQRRSNSAVHSDAPRFKIFVLEVWEHINYSMPSQSKNTESTGEHRILWQLNADCAHGRCHMIVHHCQHRGHSVCQCDSWKPPLAVRSALKQVKR
mmetsp:Transcript_4403/g.13461  ORF Transcript_4403/g.13461 Transcript_4403/m.13461 type:complete len:159 (-) Transcript_4403:35-511(-)